MKKFEKQEIKFARVREVTWPEQAYEQAAGIDFFIPTNLTVKDFNKNIKIYTTDDNNKSVYFSCNLTVKHPEGEQTVYLVFYLKNKDGNPENTEYVLLNEPWENQYSKKDIEDAIVTKITLFPGGKVLIPSGIRAILPPNIALVALNKSGVASKRQLLVGAQLIDSDYRGEMHINLNNVSQNKVDIYAGEKIVQFVPMYTPNVKLVECTPEDVDNALTERADKGFGSSNIKTEITTINATESTEKTSTKK